MDSVPGQMMKAPLLVSSIIRHAARYHGDVQVVSRDARTGGVHRYGYGDCETRSRKLASSLQGLGVTAGDRVGTIAWNGHRHLELYYAVSGMGAVCHTINPRYSHDLLAYVINHADDRLVFFDLDMLDLVVQVAASCPKVKSWVCMTDAQCMPVPEDEIALVCYETLLEESDAEYAWPALDEEAASSLCYTSGTTGKPKGVLYSHRSTVLHALAVALPDSMGCSSRDTILPVVPMFHASAWGLAYIAPMVGARLVLPGSQLDGETLFGLIEGEGVTVAAGVPTVWQGLLQHLEQTGERPSTLRRLFGGGSAVPQAMFEAFDRAGVQMLHSWGMTELSPVGVIGALHGTDEALTGDARMRARLRQGRPPFGVDLRVVGPDGAELPRDSSLVGELQARGSWVLDRYFGQVSSPLADGWFPTGDIASLDRHGGLHISDRSKDLIKSGGEWISSIAVEDAATSFKGVAMAACVAAAHPRWGERPVLIVQLAPGVEPDEQGLLDFLRRHITKFEMPNRVVFVDALPLTGTGKVLKHELRARFWDCLGS